MPLLPVTCCLHRNLRSVLRVLAPLDDRHDLRVEVADGALEPHDEPPTPFPHAPVFPHLVDVDVTNVVGELFRLLEPLSTGTRGDVAIQFPHLTGPLLHAHPVNMHAFHRHAQELHDEGGSRGGHDDHAVAD